MLCHSFIDCAQLIHFQKEGMASRLPQDHSDNEEEMEKLEHQQRLKAALHYSVGQVCKELKESTFSREVVAVITESAFNQCEQLATDLEMFAKHAKRTTINMDDVKLCCRRNQSLLDHINSLADKIKADKMAETEGTSSDKKGKGGKKKKTITIEDD